jgi:hypothetical protein
MHTHQPHRWDISERALFLFFAAITFAVITHV